MFFVNKKTIDTVLENTRIFELISNRQDSTEDTLSLESAEQDSNPSTTTLLPENQEQQSPQPNKVERESTAPESQITQEPEPITDEEPAIQETEEERQALVNAVAPNEENNNLLHVYFVTQEEGILKLARMDRTFPKSSTPLSENIRRLLSGPTSEEQQRGVLSLIPEESRLISAWVQDRVAYLNFNVPFRFNQYGKEGAYAQIRQIVYTATQFPTVDAVQILIDGQQLEFLSGDGAYIGSPLYPN